MLRRIDEALINQANQSLLNELEADYAALGDKLGRQNIDSEAITRSAAAR